MKRPTRKLALRGEQLRRLERVAGAAYTATDDEACSGPCCTKVSVSWCPGA